MTIVRQRILSAFFPHFKSNSYHVNPSRWGIVLGYDLLKNNDDLSLEKLILQVKQKQKQQFHFLRE